MQRLYSERIGIISLVLLAFFSYFGWYVLFNGNLLASFGSVSLSLLIGFSFACTFYFLGAVLWREQYEYILGCLVPFLPALIFMPEWIMFFAVGVSALLTYLSIWFIHKEKQERRRFQYYLVCNRGASQFIIAIAIAISAAYFLQVRDADWEEVVPKLRIDQGTTTLLLKVASWWQPELAQSETDALTVDQYLLNLAAKDENLKTDNVIQDNELFTIKLSFAPDIEEQMNKAGITFEAVRTDPVIEEQYLILGRKHFGELVGGTVTGSEPFDAIVLQLMQEQITVMLEDSDGITRLLESGVPVALAIAIFLALWSVGALLSYLWLGVGFLIYMLLLKYKQIIIVEQPEQVQALEIVD